MINDTFDYGLSDDQLIQIAKIGLNWSAAEFAFSVALSQFYSIDQRIAMDLIYPREARAILNIFRSRKADLSPHQKSLIDEAIYCFEKFKPERNLYAHGLIFTGDDGSKRIHSLRGKESNPDQIPKILEKAIYARLVANHFLFSILGMRHSVILPKRP